MPTKTIEHKYERGQTVWWVRRSVKEVVSYEVEIIHLQAEVEFKGIGVEVCYDLKHGPRWIREKNLYSNKQAALSTIKEQ